MSEQELLVDCLRRLDRTGVTYYLTSLMASNYWGIPRTTAEDVILHKLIWSRITPSERQLGDAAGIVAVQADALEKDYLNRWAVELGLAAELNAVLNRRIKPKQT